MTNGTFRPSINGYSIRGLKTMLGKDGYITRCSLLKDGKKVGDYFDPADGGPYDFTPSVGVSEQTLEKEISSFPRIHRDYGFELPEVDWDIGILVDELVNLGDRFKAFKKAMNRGFHMATIDVWKTGQHFTADVPKVFDDSQSREGIATVMRKQLGNDAYPEITIYRSEADFTIILREANDESRN